MHFDSQIQSSSLRDACGIQRLVMGKMYTAWKKILYAYMTVIENVPRMIGNLAVHELRHAILYKVGWFVGV